jgi:hypothetical protein
VVLDAEGAKYQVVPTIEEAANSRQSCAGDLNESILEADGINVVAMAGSTTSEAAITSFGHILRRLILRNFFIFYQVCIHR